MSSALFDSLAHAADDGAAPGCTAVLLPRDAGTAQTFAYGSFAGPGSPNVSIHTVYDVASLTKLFTTALLLRLHEQNKLSVYDRCGIYLENFQHSELRLIDLLTHRVDFGIALADYRAKFPSQERLRDALLALPAPSKRTNFVNYANLAFFYLGLVVEGVMHAALRDAVTALCRDLALEHTYTGADIAQLGITTPPTEITGGVVVQGVTHDETARMLGGLTGHAGIFSAATDLAAFGRAWLDGKIVSPKTLEQLVYKDYDPVGDKPQALGWWLRLVRPDGTYVSRPDVYVHNGFTGCLLAISPRTGKTAAFMCNRTYYGRSNLNHRESWQLIANWVAA